MSNAITSIAETTAVWAEQRELECVFTTQAGSTNDDAKKAAMNESADFFLYITGHQTAGRGRGTNTWLDTGNGESLLSTWSFKVDSPPQAITAPRIGLAVFRAINSVWPSLEWGLKAPNDLQLSGNKIGGLLVESVSSGGSHRLLIGFGMNVLNHPRKFTEAEHLSETLSSTPDEGEWFQFLDELLAELQRALGEIVKPTLSATACTELATALNANSSRAYTVQSVSPQGDLVHSGGKIRWTDL